MDVIKAKRTLKQLAQREGVSVDTVRHEMEIAIAAALENTDPQAREFWMSVPHKGKYPTPEEVIAYIADMTKRSPTFAELSKKIVPGRLSKTQK